MDNFTELLIEREVTSATAVIKMISWILVGLATVIMGVILFILAGPFAVSFALIVLFFLIYANMSLLNMFYIEFEYSLVNNYFDIDKIIGAKKRERMLSVKINNIYEIGRYNGDVVDDNKYSRVISPVSSMKSENLWYFITEEDDGKKYYVIFEPDNRVLSHLNKFISRKITNGSLEQF